MGRRVILRARRNPRPFPRCSMNYAVRLMHTLRWVGIAGVILGGTSARGSEIANPGGTRSAGSLPSG